MEHPILQAIAMMEKLPYGSGSDVGGVKELNYLGTSVLKKGTRSICSSATYEVLWRALEIMGKLTKLNVEILQELKNWAWVMGEETTSNPYYTGIAGGVVEFGLGSWVCRSAYSTPMYDHPALGDPSLLAPGDVAQMFDYSGTTKTFGHSVIIVGHTVNADGSPAVMTFSSDGDPNNGHGYDYWSLTHPNTSKKREWFGARLIL